MNIRFLDTIVEKENLFLKEVRDVLQSCPDEPLFIWGSGLRGQYTETLLNEQGLHYDGIVSSRRYYQPKEKHFILEDLPKQFSKFNLIIAFCGYTPTLLEPLKENIHNIIFRDTVPSLRYKDDFYLTYDWVVQNKDSLEALYFSLEDDLSRKSLSAFINQKISGDFKYMTSVQVPNEYFMDDIITFGKDEVFIDCGAYTGDTAESFVEAVKKQNGTIKEIISFEPEPTFFNIMKDKHLPNHTCVRKGVSDSKTTLYFKSESTSSRIDESGEMSIELDTIDNQLGNRTVSYIKMDIEGEEIKALNGAKHTILHNRPKLAICIYHKTIDLLTIPTFIKQLGLNYKFYIRAHETTSTELVLYAI